MLAANGAGANRGSIGPQRTLGAGAAPPPQQALA